MRIQHKYIRNRHCWRKNWQRIRVTEHPFETLCPWWGGMKVPRWDVEEQIKDHFEWITEQARRLENGSNRVSFKNASSGYRRMLNGRRKAKERHAMARINMGDWDYEVPRFKNDAVWLYW